MLYDQVPTWKSILRWGGRYFLFIFSFAFLTQSLFSWEKILDEEGILVERIYVPGESIIKFRGKGLVDAPVLKILAVISDPALAKKWNKNAYNQRIVERLNDREVIFYAAHKTPWPFQDRDMLLKIKFSVDEQKRYILIQSRETSHPAVPAQKGLHRVKFARVTWYLKPLKKFKGQKTWVEFTAHMDPGGNIPSWLMNLVSKKIPFHTIKNIREMVRSNQVNQKFYAQYKRFEGWY